MAEKKRFDTLSRVPDAAVVRRVAARFGSSRPVDTTKTAGKRL